MSIESLSPRLEKMDEGQTYFQSKKTSQQVQPQNMILLQYKQKNISQRASEWSCRRGGVIKSKIRHNKYDIFESSQGYEGSSLISGNLGQKSKNSIFLNPNNADLHDLIVEKHCKESNHKSNLIKKQIGIRHQRVSCSNQNQVIKPINNISTIQNQTQQNTFEPKIDLQQNLKWLQNQNMLAQQFVNDSIISCQGGTDQPSLLLFQPNDTAFKSMNSTNNGKINGYQNNIQNTVSILNDQQSSNNDQTQVNIQITLGDEEETNSPPSNVKKTKQLVHYQQKYQGVFTTGQNKSHNNQTPQENSVNISTHLDVNNKKLKQQEKGLREPMLVKQKYIHQLKSTQNRTKKLQEQIGKQNNHLQRQIYNRSQTPQTAQNSQMQKVFRTQQHCGTCEGNEHIAVVTSPQQLSQQVILAQQLAQRTVDGTALNSVQLQSIRDNIQSNITSSVTTPPKSKNNFVATPSSTTARPIQLQNQQSIEKPSTSSNKQQHQSVHQKRSTRIPSISNCLQYNIMPKTQNILKNVCQVVKRNQRLPIEFMNQQLHCFNHSSHSMAREYQAYIKKKVQNSSGQQQQQENKRPTTNQDNSA